MLLCNYVKSSAGEDVFSLQTFRRSICSTQSNRNKHPEWCNALKRPVNVKPNKEDVVPYCSSGDWLNLKNLVKTFVCQRAAEKKWDWTLSLHEVLCTFLYFILITSWLRVSPTQADSETHSVISCHLSSLKSFLRSFKWDQSSCLLWGFICLKC